MTQKQLKSLHREIHFAVGVQGKAKSWQSAVHRQDLVIRAVLVDVIKPKRSAVEGLCEILRRHGLGLQLVSGNIAACYDGGRQ